MRPAGRWSLPVRQGTVWMEWVYLLEFPVCTLKAALQNGVQEGGLGRRRNWEDFTPTMRLDQIAKGMSKDRALEPSKRRH